MRLSIRARMVLAMSLLTAAVGGAVGWAAIALARRAVERRLVHEAAGNAAGLLGRNRWPIDSDDLMRRLAEILGSQTATTSLQTTAVLSSSLSPRGRAELARRLAGEAAPGHIRLEGRWYRVGSAVVRRRAPGSQAPALERRLYLLVPEQRVLSAQRDLARQIALCTLAAVAVAMGVGFWMSTSIARPIRRLADRMDRLARDDAPDAPHSGTVQPAGGPSELARLTGSFDALMSRLAAARDQLDRSARLAGLGELAGAVAHELRNPLSGIKMNARILADELPHEKAAARSLELIVREIERMDVFLQELLALAGGTGRADAAPAPPPKPVRLDELAESVLALLAGRCRHAGVDVRRRYAPGCPPALADAERLRQVILNLVVNALDAMPHGGCLTVGCGADGGHVRLEIADTGPGVQPPGGRDIFEPFVTGKPRGTGLGLYLCRRTVETYGGRVGYTSSEAGCTFWVRLPAAT